MGLARISRALRRPLAQQAPSGAPSMEVGTPEDGNADGNPAPVDPRLVESEARYRAVIENASDMIQSIRPDGTFEFVNRAWLEKLGYTEDEVGQLIVWDIIHPDSIEHCQVVFARAIGGEPIEHMEAIFLTKDGQPVPVEGSATSRLLNGEVIATHGFFRDISERLRAQALEARNVQLEKERLAQYLEKMAALGKLSAGLAHELNNPAAAAQRASKRLSEGLTARDTSARSLHDHGLSPDHWRVIEQVVERARDAAPAQGGASPIETSEQEEAIEQWLEAHEIAGAWDLAPGLVRAGITAPMLDELTAQLQPADLAPAVSWIGESLAVRELADVVARSTQRISELVSAVKAYSYMDRATEQVVDVHADIENTLIILAHRLGGVTVKRDYDPNLPEVRALGSTLNQVWTNILDNAVDATDGRGTISIRTRGRGDQVVVEIEDDGCGIPAEHQTRIFEPFFSTKGQGRGIGLGLDTAWRIVTEEHQGMIEVESEPGSTVFRVTLPTASAPEAGGGRREAGDV